MTPQTVILTGMHRSGTSLIASILQRAGVDIGRNLMASDTRNPRGFFEDLDFFYFHERALQDRGTTPYVRHEFLFEATSAEREEAARLVAARQAMPLWGWKDPRSALFLEFWHEVLPEARFLFVYRHPLEVLLSLVRRVEAHTVGLLEGLTTWVEYNSRILAFREKHPEACLLCHTLTALSRPEDLGRLIASRLGVPISLDRSTVESLYHREELRRLPRSGHLDDVLREAYPEAMAVYERLEAQAELASGEEHPAIEPDREAGFERLSRAMACLERPHPASRVRGLLVLLLATLDPELLERYYPEHERYVFNLEREGGRLQAALEAESKALRQQAEWLGLVEANNAKKQEWIEMQEGAIKTLEGETRACKEWIQTLETDNQAKQRVIDVVEAELRGIHGSDAWRVAQRLSASAPGRLAIRLLRRRRVADKEPA